MLTKVLEYDIIVLKTNTQVSGINTTIFDDQMRRPAQTPVAAVLSVGGSEQSMPAGIVGRSPGLLLHERYSRNE